jgi:hypothetical protein
MLKKLGQPTSGVKSELLDRLKAAKSENKKVSVASSKKPVVKQAKKLPLAHIRAGKILRIHKTGCDVLEHQQFIKLDQQNAGQYDRVIAVKELNLINLSKHFGDKALRRLGKILDVDVEGFSNIEELVKSGAKRKNGILPIDVHGVLYGYGSRGKTRILICPTKRADALKKQAK